MRSFFLFIFASQVAVADIAIETKAVAGRYPVAWSLVGFKEPESVYFDSSSGILFVSNIAGAGNKKDRVGWIDKIDPKTGVITTPKWISGLSAPKGMRSHNGILWVSNIDEILGFEIATGKVTARVPVKGAKFLNDIAIDADGAVYVSDTLTSKIHKFAKGKLSTFVSGPSWESPNGLLVQGDELVVAAWGLTTDWSTKTPGNLYSINLKSKKRTPISSQPVGNLDGLESLGNGKYIVSDWSAGVVYEVGPEGKIETVLSKMVGSADLAVLESPRVVVVPRMGENTVTAFSLLTLAPKR